MKDIDVVGLVVSSINEILVEDLDEENEKLPVIEPATRLLGKHGVLDSHALVSAIVNIEEELADTYDVSVIIADERAMSQEKSPFRTVDSLADYITVLIKEQIRDE